MPAVIAKIAVSAALYSIDKPYDYLVPESMAGAVSVGMRVYVPFGRGNRISEGIVLAVSEKSELAELKSIIRVLDSEPVLTNGQIRLALFMRDRFFCTVYDAARAMLPSALWFKDDGKRNLNDKTVEIAKLAVSTEDASDLADRKRSKAPKQAEILDMLCSFECLPVKDMLLHAGAKRTSLNALIDAGIVETFTREVYSLPKVTAQDRKDIPTLNEEQFRAYEGIRALMDSGKASAALLFGVTGSGKTSVYVKLIHDALENGRSAILLVPEISLTPQMLNTFSAYFGDEVAVLHSSLTMRERYDEWKRVKRGEARLVIGTRSAIFAPVENLGIIIIDEEQEETYKSENSPRYNARDIAKYLCARSDSLLLLGSATPDIASMYNARRGKYSLFELKERYNDMTLPKVQIVDMKRELRHGNSGDISSFLRDELRKNIDSGEQSILFINRRGANKLVSCIDCGFVYKCPKCSVPMTYHSSNGRLMCHYCGMSRKIDNYCPDCGGTLHFSGSGTQHIEEELHELFPGTATIRLDTDTVTPAGSHEVLFEKFKNENIPIMIGTQMVTKGLNFENVTLVGVILADQSLYSGDYRAGERTFSLLTQVVGRSGRGEKPGRAIIQTFTPYNETIVQAAQQDYTAFYESEIEFRKFMNSPPMRELFTITVSGISEEHVRMAVHTVFRLTKEALSSFRGVDVLGPAPLSVVKVNNRFRYRVSIYSANTAEIRNIISNIVIDCSKDKSFKELAVFADNDPSY